MWIGVLAGVVLGSAITWLYMISRTIVLEEFTGTVDSIYEGTAYVTLVSKNQNEELEGQYPAADLAKMDILLHDRFLCKTLLIGGKAEVVFEHLPVISFKRPLQYRLSPIGDEHEDSDE